jgi:hypothetical protein
MVTFQPTKLETQIPDMVQYVAKKGSAEISILAQILLSRIRFVPFSYIRISGWFCHNVDIAARFEGEFLRS